MSNLLACLGFGGIAACLLLGGLKMASAADAPPKPATPASQIVILKLDDVVAITPNWQRVIDYCEKNKIKAGLGIICESLGKDDPAYFKWLKDTRKKGFIEFWSHGYAGAPAFYEKHTLDEQTAALARCEKLAQDKLGFSLPAFGPHYSATTADTEKAVEKVPEIKIWLYGPKNSKFYTRLSIPRVMALEYAVSHCDFDKFKTDYEKWGAKQNVLVLQGHANYWDPATFETFTKIIDFLKSKNVTFMTPSEYLESLSPKPKPR